MRRVPLIALVIVMGCGGREIGADAGGEIDAHVPEFDAMVSPDAGRDAGELDRDGGRDAAPAPDAFVPPVDAFVPEPDAGPPPACDLYRYDGTACTQCPNRGEGCRRTRDDTDFGVDDGPAACQEVGTILEHNRGYPGLCSRDDPDRFCGCGLFCRSGRCVRYCDPAGEPCPNTSSGSPQHCVTVDPGTTTPTLVPYCHF